MFLSGEWVQLVRIMQGCGPLISDDARASLVAMGKFVVIVLV